MDNNNSTHGKLIDLGNGIHAFVDGIPDKCEHEWGGGSHLLISPRPDSDHGWSYTIAVETVMRMHPDKSKGEAIERYGNDLKTGGHYIAGSCTSCKNCGKLYTPPFW